MLVYGLPRADHPAIRANAVFLLAGVGVGGTYVVYMVRRAREAVTRPPPRADI